MRSILFTAILALLSQFSFGICDPATITPSLPQTICAGGSVVLYANTGTGYAYQWYNGTLLIDGATNSSFTANASGSYTVIITNASDGSGGTCPASTSSAIVITVNALPTATITPATTTTFCQGGSVVLNANTGTDLTYQWKLNGNNITGAMSSSYTANASGSYTVVVTNANSCSLTSTATLVTVNSLPISTITPASTTTFCQGGSVVLNASTGAGLTYQWKKDGSNLSGATAPSYSANTSGSYTVVVTNTSSCSATSAATVVTVNALPTATITSATATTFCQGGSVVLNANTGTGLTYQWKLNGNNITGATNANYSANASGSYTVVVTNASTCSATSTATAVTVNTLPVAPTSPVPGFRCGAGTVSLSATAPLASTIDWYSVPTGGSTVIGGTGVTSFTTPSILATTTYYAEARNTTTGCVSATRTAVTATVNVVPVVGNISLTICSGAGFSEIPQNGGGNVIPSGTQYSWTVANDSILGESSSVSFLSSISQQSLVNSTISNQVVEYTVTPQTPACPGNSFTISVTVSTNAIPVVNDPSDQSICAGSNTAAVNFIVSPVIPNTVYNWTNSNPSIGIGASGSGNIASFTAANATNAALTSNIVVTPSYTVSGLTCTGVSQTFSITVNPTPLISNKTTTVCSTTAFTQAPPNGGGDIVPSVTTYTWTVASNPNVLNETANNTPQTSISQTLTNTLNTAETVIYTVTPLSGSCPGSTFTVTVTISPKPTISNKTSTICSATAFTQAPSNGAGDIVPSVTTYTWTVASNPNVLNETANNTPQTSISQTLTNTLNTAETVTYTVTPLSGSCPGSTFTINVTVSPKPTIANKTEPICSGTAFAQTPMNVGGDIVPSNTNYTWTVANNSNVNGESSNAGAQTSIGQSLINTLNTPEVVTYTVTPQSGLCTGSTFTVAVTVNPKPSIANNSNTTSTSCSGTLFNQSPSNGNGDIVPSGTTYTWTIASNANLSGQTGVNIGQNSIGQTLTNSTNISQNLTYTVIPVAGLCTGTSFNLIVTIKPKPSITTNLEQTICSEQQFTFTPQNNTNGIVPANTTLTWAVSNSNVTGEQSNPSSGVGTLNQTLTNTAYTNNQVVYTITPVANSCTGNPFDYTVTVNKAPNLSVTPTSTICEGNSIQLFAVDAFNTGQLFYNWTNASTLNSSFIFNPIATPQTSTTYTVSAIDNTTQCQVSRNVTVNVLQQAATISFTTPTSFCQGGSVILSANSGAGLSYQWKFNDTAIPGATSVTYPAISSGVYTVVVTNSSDCSKTSNGQTVTVYPLPVASISSLSSTTFCAGESVILTTTALSGNSYQWTRNGTNLQGAVSNSFQAVLSGNYTVQVVNSPILSITCSSTSPGLIVTVNALPSLSISAIDSQLCVGESTNLNVTGASSYSWTPTGLVSNSSSANPSVFPISTTNFGVTGTDQNGCSNYAEIQITVVPNPTLDLPNAIEACEGSIVSLPGSAAIDWSGITPLADFTAQQSGYAIATLQNSNLCTTLDSIYLQVNPLPTPDVTGSVAVCANASYSEYSVISSGNAYSWSVSNGELQGIDNGNTAYIHWLDMEYGPTTFVTVTEHDYITGCEGSDTLFVAFSGLAPNTTNVNLLDPNGSTLYSENHYAVMNWGSTIISNDVDEYIDGHEQYFTFLNFDTALRYYWIEAGDDSLCLTRTYYNAPVWQVGVEESQNFSAVNIYPNPTSGLLYISHESNVELSSVRVFDLTGHLIKENLNPRNQTSFDVSELPSGFYILKLVSSSGQNANKTFVKE
jgi:hypothetical protein